MEQFGSRNKVPNATHEALQVFVFVSCCRFLVVVVVARFVYICCSMQRQWQEATATAEDEAGSKKQEVT